MGQLIFPTRNKIPYQRHKNTAKERFSGVRLDRAVRILDSLGHALPFEQESVVYAVGSTFKEKSVIDDLEKDFPVKVVRIGRFRNQRWWFWLIPGPMPRLFVIKVFSPACIREVFDRLFDYILLDIAVFNKVVESRFLSEIWDDVGFSPHMTSSIKEDSRYFIYGVDTDNEESETGILEVISYGKDAPKSLIDII